METWSIKELTEILKTHTNYYFYNGIKYFTNHTDTIIEKHSNYYIGGFSAEELQNINELLKEKLATEKGLVFS